MARDKDRAINPATAALKKAKNAEIKKSKAAQTASRNEKLSKRNPNTIQKQIDELKSLKEAQGGSLKGREGKTLEGLERDLRVIQKSREGEGGRKGVREEQRERRERVGDDGVLRGGRGGGRDGADGFRGVGRGGARGDSMLGKRRREGEDIDSASEDTDPEVRGIPMPKDSPPPVPRRPRRHASHADDDTKKRRGPHSLPVKPGRAAAPAQTTYSSAPQVRDLQREAVSRFLPAAVAARVKQRQIFQGGGGGQAGGEGQRLLEPEEVDRLEKEGYLDARKVADEAAKEEAFEDVAANAAHGDNIDGMADGGASLEDEEAAFERELREAELEQEGVGDVDAGADTARHQVADEVMADAREAAAAATEENEHIIQVDAADVAPNDVGGIEKEPGRKAQTQMKLVEVEDVSDDEW